MKKYLQSISLLVAILFTSYLSAQTPKGFQWIQHHGDFIDFDPEIVRDIAVDRFGNVYVAGQVNDLFVRDSSGTIIKSQRIPSLDSLHNNGGVDIWLAKYSSTSNLLWHRYAGGGSDDDYFDMVADDNGNCYVSGRIRDHNLRKAKSFNKTPLATSELGSFIAKINSSGNLVWHKTFDGGSTSTIPYLATTYDLSLRTNELECYFYGGGTTPFGYQLLFGQDSLELGIHTAAFDLNGNYQSVKTFPFPRYDRLPQVRNISSNENGTLITAILSNDTAIVGTDTLLNSGFNNAMILAFDTNLNHTSTFLSNNIFDQFINAELWGDSLAVSGHFNTSSSNTVLFDTFSVTASPNATQSGALFIFDITGQLLGLYPSGSVGSHTQQNSATTINQNYMGIGGSFNYRMTYSGTNTYMEAVDNCVNCRNSDAYFAVFKRDGTFLAEDVIYSSGPSNDVINAIAFSDTMVYVAGFLGDSVIINGVDTFVTRGRNDAFVAGYHLGTDTTTSIAENSNYIKADNGLLAYPNPNNGQFTIMGKPLNNIGQLYSIKGQLVQEVSLSPNAFQQQLNFEGLKPGVYFFMVISNTVTSSGVEKQQLKIVVQ